MSTGRGKGKSKKANDECSNKAYELRDGSLQKRVYDFIAEKGITTCDMAELSLGLSHQSCSAAFNHLMNKGKIEKSGLTATTRYGRQANLFRVVERETLFPL